MDKDPAILFSKGKFFARAYKVSDAILMDHKEKRFVFETCEKFPTYFQWLEEVRAITIFMDGETYAEPIVILASIPSVYGYINVGLDVSAKIDQAFSHDFLQVFKSALAGIEGKVLMTDIADNAINIRFAEFLGFKCMAELPFAGFDEGLMYKYILIRDDADGDK